VVASSFGTLASLDPRLHSRLDVGYLSPADVDRLMDGYVKAVETGRAPAEGWPDWINPPSKVGQVAAMKVLARELAGEAAQRDILVNAACPGLVDTDASRPWFDDMSRARSPGRGSHRLDLARHTPRRHARALRRTRPIPHSATLHAVGLTALVPARQRLDCLGARQAMQLLTHQRGTNRNPHP
jgi:hypothetical protein